jgi:hypothetical protein
MHASARRPRLLSPCASLCQLHVWASILKVINHVRCPHAAGFCRVERPLDVNMVSGSVMPPQRCRWMRASSAARASACITARRMHEVPAGPVSLGTCTERSEQLLSHGHHPAR